MIDIFLSISLLLYFLFIVFIISGLFRHSEISFSETDILPKVSVIVAARNEESNLPYLITDLLNQSYPIEKIEIIIVNDRSTDKTSDTILFGKQSWIDSEYINNGLIELFSKLI